MAFALKKEYQVRYSYDDYIRWEGRWELIDGFPYDKSPAPSLKHQVLNTNIVSELRSLLSECSKCVASIYADWKINDNTVVQPDAFVYCGKIEGQNLSETPPLIFEIVSPSSTLKDKIVKMELYHTQKVKYYVLVFPLEENLEVYQWSEKEYELKLSGRNGLFPFDMRDCKFDFDFSKIWS